jgi:hypothetical protein
MKRICVFCGSSPGSRPEYGAAAEEMGAELARRNIGLVYGGGNVGLMGDYRGRRAEGGRRGAGVIPEHLMARQVGHRGLRKLHLVRSMHERKANRALVIVIRKQRCKAGGSFVMKPLRRAYMERETGVEPATSTLARSRSTTELLPLNLQD